MEAGKFPAGMRVLAVDDDRVSLMILEKQLKHCYYNVTAVTDANAALDMLRERKDRNQFHLVITDVVRPDIDGFKLLELIGLEMDIPVIMLSANNETKTVMKGINHGACDYLVKPVRLEQLRGIWTHVVRNSKNNPRIDISDSSDDADQKFQSEDGDKDEQDGENHTSNYSKKKKKDINGADEDKENRSTQKRQRVQWSGDLHRNKTFVALNTEAVPKNILEVMNVDGLTRENVASHLQKYRIYLKKLIEGKVCDSNRKMNVSESSKRLPELDRYQSSPSFVGSPRSNSLSARMNSPPAFGAHTFLSTQSVQELSHRNSSIARQDMEQVGSGFNMSGASRCFHSVPSGSSFANISNGAVFKTSRPLSIGISSSSFANISNDSSPLGMNMRFPSPRSCSSYASMLRGKILGASRGIPFEDIADGEVLAPSGHLSSLKVPELVNQPSVQIPSSSCGLFNQVSREAHQFAGPSNSSVGMYKGPSQGNIIKINQLSRLAASSGQIPTFGNVYQNQIAGIIGQTAPMVGFSEQVAPFNFESNTHYTSTPTGNSDLGSSSSTTPTLPNFQIDNSVMPAQMLNGAGASSENLPKGVTVTTNQQAVGDQMTFNSNKFLIDTSEAQNGASGDLDEVFADWINEVRSLFFF
ncbi:hypothetical protein HU200_042692 [Digitaria exilis]|uniref:Response regulatory domain-containing protein n=1 Tax=Digitaria exilis TaxID=1010633 RepID=A0A835B5R7_9POAL|nr:hypothetical protein HU200_042692 [Digitaria exilis]